MTRRLSVAAILLLPVAVAAADLQQPAPYAFRGAVQQVQPKTGALDVITGVGMALRLVHMRTTPDPNRERCHHRAPRRAQARRRRTRGVPSDR